MLVMSIVAPSYFGNYSTIYFVGKLVLFQEFVLLVIKIVTLSCFGNELVAGDPDSCPILFRELIWNLLFVGHRDSCPVLSRELIYGLVT